MVREPFIEAAVSIAAVALFLVAIVVVGVVYPDLSGAGPFALLGSLALFVVVMVGAGYWLSGR